MTCFVSHTTVDAHNAYELSEWWKQLLGYVDLPDDPNLPGHEECLIQSPDGTHQILFLDNPDTPYFHAYLHDHAEYVVTGRCSSTRRPELAGAERGQSPPRSGWPPVG